MIIGPEILSKFLPYSSPLLMVDNVTFFSGEKMEMHTERFISGNERVFDGHFPDLKLWPGIYTIEGLKQSCILLKNFLQVRNIEELKSLQQYLRFKALSTPIDQNFLSGGEYFSPKAHRIKIKLLEPVFAGSKTEFQVKYNSSTENFKCLAIVNAKIVAKGSIKFM